MSIRDIWPVIIEFAIPCAIWGATVIFLIISSLAKVSPSDPFLAIAALAALLGLFPRMLMLDYEWERLLEWGYGTWDRVKTGIKLRQLPIWLYPGNLCLGFLWLGLGSLARGSILGAICGAYIALMYLPDHGSRWAKLLESRSFIYHCSLGFGLGLSGAFIQFCRYLVRSLG